MIRHLIPLLLLVAAMGCGGPSPQDGPPGGGPAGAPSGPPPGARPEMDPAQRLENTMREITIRLKLKPGQAAKVKQIIRAGEDKKQKLFEQGSASNNPKDMQKMFEGVHQVELNTQKALSKVLTEDQMDEYIDYLKGQRKRFESEKGQGGGPGGPPGGGRPGSRPGGF
ncbi:MAG: hypothetical protein KQI62_05035 [Deltaproteobacteria bacterium]|nr:hypothetical protein [Deltaproteobacteria bacterium]